jgi:hypothetical protein
MNDVIDRLAIQDLTARYSFYLDKLQMEPWLSLWTEEGIFDETLVGTGYHEGQVALRACFKQIMDVMADMVHFGGTHIIEIKSESEATGILYAMVEGHTQQGGSVSAVIYYEDTYRKVAGKWRFAKRKVIPLLPIDISGFTAGQQAGDQR